MAIGARATAGAAAVGSDKGTRVGIRSSEGITHSRLAVPTQEEGFANFCHKLPKIRIAKLPGLDLLHADARGSPMARRAVTLLFLCQLSPQHAYGPGAATRLKSGRPRATFSKEVGRSPHIPLKNNQGDRAAAMEIV